MKPNPQSPPHCLPTCIHIRIQPGIITRRRNHTPVRYHTHNTAVDATVSSTSKHSDPEAMNLSVFICRVAIQRLAGAPNHRPLLSGKDKEMGSNTVHYESSYVEFHHPALPIMATILTHSEAHFTQTEHIAFLACQFIMLFCFNPGLLQKPKCSFLAPTWLSHPTPVVAAPSAQSTDIEQPPQWLSILTKLSSLERKK